MQIIYTHVHIYLYMYIFVQGNVYKEGSREKKKEKKEGRKEERKEGTYLNFPMRVARFFEMARFFVSALLAVSSPPEHWSWSCSTRAFFEKKFSAGTGSELRRALQQHAHNDCHCTAADAVAKDGVNGG